MKLITTVFMMALGALCSAQILPLAIVSKTPAGQLSEYSSADTVTISFNQPVAAISDESQSDGNDCPIKISPQVKGECRWLGSQTLVFTPQKPFEKAVRYVVTIDKGFTSSVTGAALPKTESWFFDTPRPQIAQALPSNGEGWLNLEPKLILAFNMPIGLNTLNRYISLKEGSKNIPFKIARISDELFESNFKYSSVKKDSVYTVTPVKPLSPAAGYTLTVRKGLRALKGNLAMPKDYTVNFSTYNKFNLAAAPEAQCLPFTPSLQFTNPVTAGEVYKNISFDPEIVFTPKDENNTGWEDTVLIGKEKRRVFNLPLYAINFKAGQQYKVTLKADTQDIFGNKLGREIKFVWDNNGYCPAVTFKGGFGVIEQDQKPYHPADAVNAGEVPVEKMRINYRDFIPFFKDEPSYCQKRTLKGDVIKSVWNPNQGALNIPLNTFFDLAPALNAKGAGLVFLQFKNPFKADERECWQNSIDNVTNIGLTLKTSPQDTLVWATYLSDGKPAKAKKVELRDAKNNVIWEGKTNSKGLAAAPGWAKLKVEKENEWSNPEIWAFVKDDESVAVISSDWDQGIQPWRFNINYNFNPDKVDLKTFVFTDRGLYRQGESVYIKAVMRKFKEGVLNYSGLDKVSFLIVDPTGKDVVKRDIPVDEFSASDYTYNIPSNGASGYWNVFIEAEGVNGYASFKVEAVKPAEFKVDLIPLADIYLAGSQAAFGLNANYMFGAPMAGADVRWNARLTPGGYTPKGYGDYTFNAWWINREFKEENLLSASSVLDEAGADEVKITLPEVETASSLYVEAGVLSPQNQELYARKTVNVLPADLLIGLKQKSSNMVKSGETVSAEIVTLDAEGKTVNTALQASLVRDEYFSVRKSGLSGRLEWVSEENIIPVAEASLNTTDGKAQWDFVPLKAGSYRLTVTGTDAEGRRASSGISFYVSSCESVCWKQNDDDLLEITPEKDSYKPGDKAKILIKSPYDKAQALITVERNGVLDSFTKQVKGGAVYIDIPVKENYLPNVFVSVVLVKGRGAAPDIKDKDDLGKPQAKFGYGALKIETTSRKLFTKIETDKTKYEPAQEVKVKLSTVNDEGKGRAASVTLFVVDEGLLTDFETPDIFNFFYSSEPLSVSTADNRLYLIGQRSFGQKGENRGGGGSDSKLGGIDLRSNFKFTPYYSASVKTDKKGRAEVSFKLPDNLTKFRIMAVAAAESDFGSAQSAIEVAKPVMIKPVLPRFARLNDTFDCGFTVYNYTDADNLTLDLKQSVTGGVRFNEGGAVAVTLKAGGSKNIMGSCTAYQLGAADFAFAASSIKGKDGLKITLPVIAVEQSQVAGVSSSTDDDEKQNLVKPKNLADTDKNFVGVSFASTALLNLTGAVDYLFNYPYNCLEQQLSRIAPAINGMDMLVAFNLAAKTELEDKIKKTLASLPDYQTPQGGFAYWPAQYESSPYITAYALEVISKAKAKGYNTDAETQNRAIEYLKSYLSSDTKGGDRSSTTRAYAIYALALNGVNVSGHFNNLYTQGVLPLEAQILMFKAAKYLNMTQALNKYKTDIMNYAKFSNETMYFKAHTESLLGILFTSDTLVTAQALQAMYEVAGGMPNGEKAVKWLLDAKNKQANWGNTITNATVFNALSAYFNTAEQKAPNFSAAFKVEGKKLFDAIFIGRSTDRKDKTFSFDEIFTNDIAQTVISKTGDGRLYYNLAMTYYPQSFKDPVTAGFKVDKKIKPLYDNLGPLAAGHRALIELTVTTDQRRSFVVLEDFLPAGFEIIDTSMSNQSALQQEMEGKDSSYYFNRVERYDDKLAVFADDLPMGVHKFTYIVQAVAGGDYYMPATRVSQMYYPEVFGRTASGKLVIQSGL